MAITVHLVRRQNTMSRVMALLLIFIVALTAAACGSGSTSPSTVTAVDGPLVVKDAWVRAAAAGADTAVYFTIVNGTAAPDMLLSAATDAAQAAGIHETTTDASGMTGMHMLPSLEIPGGGTVQFAPGGYHVMLTSLKRAISAGDTVTVTLTFQNAGVVTVNAQARAN
jgi:copper(I)-binding protein